MTRDEALTIVRKYVKNENLVRHMLAVEAAMAAYAKKFNEDEERWRVAVILHDFDFPLLLHIQDSLFYYLVCLNPCD